MADAGLREIDPNAPFPRITPRMFRRSRTVLLLGVLVLAAAMLWAVIPGPDRFRSFDPEEVAHAETEMWRAYYERRRVDLATGLVFNARRNFGLSPYDSARAGLAAAQAARTFQRSRSRTEAQAALPALTRYFAVLAEATHSDFDPVEAARLELEWWQLRREVDGSEAYAPAVAVATAYLYRVEPSALADYARLRSEAMDLRDNKGRAITDDDWRQIETLLDRAYAVLGDKISQPPPSRASAA
jgi:hypothetical protein